MPHTPPPVTCVVLNYNGAPDTIACITSLLAQDYSALSLLLIDNASTDDSVALIRAAHPSVEIVESAANNGFAAGNNIGIRLALARRASFIWLLNNDTIAPPDTLTQLVAALPATAPNLGIAGTVLRYLHAPDRIQAWGGGRIRRTIGYSRHFHGPAKLRGDSFLTFASVLIRCELFENIGLLDEGFFMYFEDADFCFRARHYSWQLTVAPGTSVLHREGGTAARHTPQTDRIITASGLRFLSHYGCNRFSAPIMFACSRLAKRLARRDSPAIRAVLLGVLDWFRHTPTAFQRDAPSVASAPASAANRDLQT